MIKEILALALTCVITLSCDNGNPRSDVHEDDTTADTTIVHLLHDIPALDVNNDVNVVVEIPAGTLEKWEVNKITGKVERDSSNGRPRTIDYLGYPGNYGMIPQTLLSKENGGDGDPLDILVLGSPVERGSVIKCKIAGVLRLLDKGEQDDKLIGIPIDSDQFQADTIENLNGYYPGITTIIETWFTNYKGPNKMKSLGFAGRESALNTLSHAITDYQNANNQD